MLFIVFCDHKLRKIKLFVNLKKCFVYLTIMLTSGCGTFNVEDLLTHGCKRSSTCLHTPPLKIRVANQTGCLVLVKVFYLDDQILSNVINLL